MQTTEMTLLILYFNFAFIRKVCFLFHFEEALLATCHQFNIIIFNLYFHLVHFAEPRDSWSRDIYTVSCIITSIQSRGTWPSYDRARDDR